MWHTTSSSKRQIPRKEAEIVAQAGRLGTVTIATNMAGRGPTSYLAAIDF